MVTERSQIHVAMQWDGTQQPNVDEESRSRAYGMRKQSSQMAFNHLF